MNWAKSQITLLSKIVTELFGYCYNSDNVITLGQRETDSYNQSILISESTKHTLGGKS